MGTKKNFKDTLILSACRPNENNKMRTLELKNFLIQNDYSYKIVDGCYKGETETSFVVVPKNQDQEEVIINLALYKYQQESVLHLDYKRQATLIYKDKQESIGNFISTTKDDALNNDAYTFCPKNEVYYIIE